MKVLLSWSKEQSKGVASALHEWLPTVAPGIDPWMSSKDIAKGHDWFRELQDVLEQTKICIICVTPENVRSPWIYYETGAIATNGPDVLICPYLFGVDPNMLVDGPLGKWQCTVAGRDDTWELIKSLNEKAFAAKHDLALLEGNFHARWPQLAQRLESISQIEIGDNEDFIATEVDQLAGINLTSEARMMVVEVSKDKNGLLLYSRNKVSTSFQTGGKNLCPNQSPRTIAIWKGALDSLVAYKILERRDSKGEIFALTAKGYEIAHELQGKT